jgi:hypothetical protein
MLDFRLTSEQEELRARARRFAHKEILTPAAYYDLKKHVPV